MNKTCPLGHQCHACLWHVRLRGLDPQSGQELDEERCALAWIPILLVENSQQQRQTSSAIELTRDAIQQQTDGVAGTLIGLINGTLSPKQLT
mgnify:CR=1 FL=1